MSITETTAVTLDDVHQLEDHAVKADRDEEIHGLKVTAAKLAEERDAERLRADQAEAAGVDMAGAIAECLRREESLHADLADLGRQLAEARRTRNLAVANARVSSEMTGAMSRDLDAKHLELRRVAEMHARLVAENTDLRTENDSLRQDLADRASRRLIRRRTQ